MVQTLARTAPDVDPTVVAATGATQIRGVFPSDQIPGILIAYMDGIRVPFAIATGAAGIAFLASGIVCVQVYCIEARKAIRDGSGLSDGFGGLEGPPKSK